MDALKIYKGIVEPLLYGFMGAYITAEVVADLTPLGLWGGAWLLFNLLGADIALEMSLDAYHLVDADQPGVYW